MGGANATINKAVWIQTHGNATAAQHKIALAGIGSRLFTVHRSPFTVHRNSRNANIALTLTLKLG